MHGFIYELSFLYYLSIYVVLSHCHVALLTICLEHIWKQGTVRFPYSFFLLSICFPLKLTLEN